MESGLSTMGHSGRLLWAGTTGPLRPGSSAEDMTVLGGDEEEGM